MVRRRAKRLESDIDSGFRALRRPRLFLLLREKTSMSDRIPMTRAGYDKLKADLAQLNDVEMPKILERLATARGEGDLSENAEYHGPGRVRA